MTHRARFWLVSMSICATAAFARAQDRTGFEGGLRVGYAIPFGKLTESGGDVRDATVGQVPLMLELGYRVTPQLFVGVAGHYGFGIVADDFSSRCEVLPEIDCSATDVRIGLEAQFHPLQGQQLDPWIGFGIGYESFTLTVEGGGVEVDTTVSGFEFAKLQAGLDLTLTEYLRVGPFMSFSLAEFADISVDCSGPSGTCSQLQAPDSITSRALHQWLLFGVRATLGP